MASVVWAPPSFGQPASEKPWERSEFLVVFSPSLLRFLIKPSEKLSNESASSFHRNVDSCQINDLDK